MAATARHTKEMQRKAEQALAADGLSSIEKLRAACLARGASGIKGIGRCVEGESVSVGVGDRGWSADVVV
jgi:hypothetical protein